MVKHLDWHHLYGESWKNEIVPAAFAHPAKYSRALIRHIYEYLIKEKMVKPGDTVLDPFGGVALGGLDAMLSGLNYVGVELEEKFVLLGLMNIGYWNLRYAGKLPRWGSAQLVQGDSRHLRGVIAAAECAASSPPYANQELDYGDRPNRAAKLANYPNFKGRTHWANNDKTSTHYGKTEGQLSNLPMSQDHNGTRGGKRGTTPAEQGAFARYGNTEGQIEGLPMTDEGYAAAVSSPPYEGSPLTYEKNGLLEDGKRPYKRNYMDGNSENYGGNKDNIANADDFWHAARTVVEETFAVLAPGAVAVWVVKDFIRAKARVPFCDQWRQLCEACGFTTYAIARAWLVEDHGTQLAMDGNHKHKRTERKSFFRRLAEKKGSPRIDFEAVLIMRKP